MLELCRCPNIYGPDCISESESESALFAKCVQTHEEFVVVFKKLLVHTCIHTYIHINIHI